MAEKRDPVEEPPPSAAHAAKSHGNGRGGHGGHGGGDHEEHEGAPEWLISFADNVMLQMGFFVILLALAMKAPGGASTGGKEGEQGTGTPSAEQLDFAIAIREAFNNPVDVSSTDANDWLLVQRLLARTRGPSAAQQDGLEGHEHDVRSIRRADGYGVGGFISFDTHSAELNEEARRATTELGERFRGARTILELRGHCSAAEAYGQEDRAMRLAYERAFAVATVLVEQGLSWTQMRLVACADGERVAAPDYTDETRRANQRVEVIELNEAAPLPDEAANSAPPPPASDGHTPKRD